MFKSNKTFAFVHCIDAQEPPPPILLQLISRGNSNYRKELREWGPLRRKINCLQFVFFCPHIFLKDVSRTINFLADHCIQADITFILRFLKSLPSSIPVSLPRLFTETDYNRLSRTANIRDSQIYVYKFYWIVHT